MKRICAWWNGVRRGWHSVHLVDRSLIVFMVLLLGQSALGLFFPWGGNETASNIDIVIRTSSAAIFGYFLSGNFTRRQETAWSGTHGDQAYKIRESGEGQAKSRIGFTADDGALLPGGAATGPATCPAACLQVTAASYIGIFCLVTLMVLRNTGWGEAASSDAVVIQFRDFVSGCVGFLIGSPTSETGRTS